MPLIFLPFFPERVAFHPTLFRVVEAEWAVSQRSRWRVNAGLDDTIPAGLPEIGEIFLPLIFRLSSLDDLHRTGPSKFIIPRG